MMQDNKNKYISCGYTMPYIKNDDENSADIKCTKMFILKEIGENV